MSFVINQSLYEKTFKEKLYVNTDLADKWNITTVNDYCIISILDDQVKANTAASFFSLF